MFRLRMIAGLAVASMLLVAVACGEADEPEPPAPTPAATTAPAPTVEPAAEAQASFVVPDIGFPFSVTDGNGNEVTFDEAPERIVAIDSATVEILFAIGAGQDVKAVEKWTDYPSFL